MNVSRLHIELNTDLVWRLFFLFSAFSIVLVASESAFAADNDVIGDTLCRLVNNLSGGIAKGIATLAIFSVGVGLFLGKLNWGIAAATAAGVGVIFSAPQLVAFLSGEDDATCTVSSDS
ncbi:MAG: TrbC/VirB2 family protein [Rickettsiaceae bacterium]|nr:TrbC/VirB2 family protein [Rickettsiaceae bacterium]